MQEVIGVEDGAAITDMDVFHKHLVLYERRAGLPCIRVLDLPLSTNPDVSLNAIIKFEHSKAVLCNWEVWKIVANTNSQCIRLFFISQMVAKKF